MTTPTTNHVAETALDAVASVTTASPRPAAGKPREYRFPDFETRILPNGLRIIVAPVRAYPVVTVLAVVEAGATRDPDGLHGLAQITTRALEEGTSAMDALQLAQRLESLGTTLDTGADWDSAIVQLTSLTSRVEDAIEVLSQVLRQPAFPESELQRLRAERMADLAQLRSEPRGLADVYFSRLAYNASSRFAKLAGGDEKSVGSLSRDSMVLFHEANYQPDSTALIIVGDISVDAAVSYVNAHFGSWWGNVGESSPAADSPRFDRPHVHLVAKADAPQSELRVGHVAVPRLNEDYFPLVVMNAILGGLFSSRLNLNLREQHAYTYGAHSAFDWRRAASPFEISTAVETAVTVDALREIVTEFDRIREAPVSASELSLATDYLIGVFPIRFETTAAIAGGLANVEIFRLPSDYFDTYRDRVRAVSAEDVHRVAREHLHPERLQIVVVGDPQLRQPLEQMEFGPVLHYDPAQDEAQLS